MSQRGDKSDEAKINEYIERSVMVHHSLSRHFRVYLTPSSAGSTIPTDTQTNSTSIDM
jgi:hypothetical protein